ATTDCGPEARRNDENWTSHTAVYKNGLEIREISTAASIDQKPPDVTGVWNPDQPLLQVEPPATSRVFLIGYSTEFRLNRVFKSYSGYSESRPDDTNIPR
ncbi:MAG: hypothetical protein V5A56_10000, partial [Halolamina sp.]